MVHVEGDASKRAESQQKLLWEIIKRYDAYINASNTKIAVILSYCMAYLGAIAFKGFDLLEQRCETWFWWATLVLALASVCATLYAIFQAYGALNPQTPPGRAGHEMPSIVFFGDVANLTGGRDGYVSRIREITESEVVEDLARQAHVLAGIVSKKMRALNASVRSLAKFQLPLGLLTVLAVSWLSAGAPGS
ncbi:Pycsar system effector family protein [Achromobacter mucicolens]|uniref:Pycsar system effector family protein n=1 Tax=Achromobacter mucicolens TaxID=1389922 RepID=UPI0022F3D11C|nr:Pycsar system effector family protein [Achromobacter mucicolens]WBX89162.1 DUF5706 domain-containing protein [Achromobacter mucicolens]